MGNESMEGRFPLNGEWAYHDATDRPYSDTRKFTSHDNIIRTYYGAPSLVGKEGVREYAEKCQVLNYEVYRSSIEAINCQAHTGYYATQKANELVHIQLNRSTMEVDVLNALHRSLENCKLHATLFSSKMEAIWSENKVVSLVKNSVIKPGWTVPSNNELSFLVLKIEDSAGKEISNNFYWLNRSNDFRGLKKLPQPKLMCTVSNLKASGKTKVKVTLMNYGNSVASFVALKLVGEKSGAELLPSYWNTNYLNILPGQTVEAIVEIDTIDVSEKPALEVTSYNMKETLRLIIP
jgi:hypothetical protein